MMICIGIPLILAGLIWGVFNFISFKKLTEAEGRVVGYERTTSDSGGLKRLPIIQFQSADGKAIRFTDDPSSVIGGRTLHIGQPDVEMLGPNDQTETVNVVYDPKDPSRAHIKNFRNMLLGPIIVVVVGVGFALAQIPAVQDILGI